jgi:hypothetical protein
MQRLLAVLVFALGALVHLTTSAEEPARCGDDPRVQAVKQYLAEIETIDAQAAKARAEARARLLDALAQARTPDRPAQEQKTGETAPGLIGAATIEGEPAGVAFHYEHGKLFPRELIWERFHRTSDGVTQFPNVTITLLGRVEVPQAMTVKISQAAGGVNGDHGTLFVGSRQLGKVGDDTAKAEVYLVSLPAGVHPVRWVLTGGTFQNNLLRLEDPATGQLLRVFYDGQERRKSGAAEAREHVEAAADPSEWLKAMGPNHWRWVPLASE